MRVAAVALSLAGSLITVTAVGDRPPLFGDHLPGLTKSQVAEFEDGRDHFAEVESVLHDMGALGDNIVQADAGARDAHLAAVGTAEITTFLHDGRATTIEDAILAHDGQAKGARDRFAALTPDSKAKRMAFLNSL